MLPSCNRHGTSSYRTYGISYGTKTKSVKVPRGMDAAVGFSETCHVRRPGERLTSGRPLTLTLIRFC